MNPEIPNNKNLENILKFLLYFESTDNEFFKIDLKYLMYPYVYSKEVDDFVEVLYKENIIIIFDWPSWQNEAEKYYNDPEFLKTTDIGTLRKLLTLHVRKERFCSGHLASMIASGHIVNILKQLKTIRDNIRINKDSKMT